MECFFAFSFVYVHPCRYRNLTLLCAATHLQIAGQAALHFAAAAPAAIAAEASPLSGRAQSEVASFGTLPLPQALLSGPDRFANPPFNNWISTP